MNPQKYKTERRLRRKRHIRKKVIGDAERPRLTVFRSRQHIYSQIIDDGEGRTLVAASSRSREARENLSGKGGNLPAAEVVGRLLAERASAAGIKAVVFDRNGYKFHGRIRKLAEAAKEGGLKF